MSATPNRSGTVTGFYDAHPEYFQEERHDEVRRTSLPSLIAHLESVHSSDRGKWGVLVKHDRGDKVPCDVIVWKDTEQSVDIMTSNGGMWGPHDGTIKDGGDWYWGPPSVVDPTGAEKALQPPPYDGTEPVEPTEPGEPGEPEPDPELEARIEALEGRVDAHADVLITHKEEIDSLRTALSALAKRVGQTEEELAKPLKVTGKTEATWGHQHFVNLDVGHK